MRSKILFTFALFVLVASPVRSDDTVHGFMEARRGIVDNPIEGGQYHFSLQGPLGVDGASNWGWFGWALVNREYSLAYVGPTYQATSWLQAGVGIGLESGYSDPLLGTFLLLSGERWSVIGVFELVEGYSWWQTTGNITLDRRFGVGFLSEKGFGIGPRVQAQFGDERLRSTFWIATPVRRVDSCQSVLCADIAVIAGARLGF